MLQSSFLIVSPMEMTLSPTVVTGIVKYTLEGNQQGSHVLGAESVPPPLRPAVEEFVRGIVRNCVQLTTMRQY